jgi:hypothetical protein
MPPAIGGKPPQKAELSPFQSILTASAAAKGGLATHRLHAKSHLHASTAFARLLVHQALARVASARPVMANRLSATQV